MTTVIVDENTPLIHPESGEFPIFLSEFSSRMIGSFPPVIEASVLEGLGYFPVSPGVVPEGDVVEAGRPVLEDGVWTRTYTSRSFSKEELNRKLQLAKADLNRLVDEHCQRVLDEGFPHTFGSKGIYHVQINESGRATISDLRMLAREFIDAGEEGEFTFRVYENQMMTLSAKEMVALGREAILNHQLVKKKSWELKEAISAAQTTEELPDINIAWFSA